MPDTDIFAMTCPLPIADATHVTLAHGGGGRRMQQLIETMFLPAFANPLSEARHDGAVLTFGDVKLAFTTDSYVVQPLFFPGGISARWRSTARRTIWPCVAPGQSISARVLSWKKGCP
jgi:hydrogenase expression/formation protein HypE